MACRRVKLSNFQCGFPWAYFRSLTLQRQRAISRIKAKERDCTERADGEHLCDIWSQLTSQGLILESGVAWTEDRDMLNLMFTLGDTPVPAAM